MHHISARIVGLAVQKKVLKCFMRCVASWIQRFLGSHFLRIFRRDSRWKLHVFRDLVVESQSVSSEASKQRLAFAHLIKVRSCRFAVVRMLEAVKKACFPSSCGEIRFLLFAECLYCRLMPKLLPFVCAYTAGSVQIGVGFFSSASDLCHIFELAPLVNSMSAKIS